VYYKKAKNQQKEIENLEKNLVQKQDLLTLLKKHLEALQAIEDFKILRNYLKDNKLEEKEEQEKEILQLFRRFQVEGFEILVGRNAANNDLLTQRHAYKEDLWLHARDVAGSHVVIKYQAGKKFPVSVIERAAQLAAYFSKRKNESLCPVIYTPKKFVRKLKGAAQGSVKIEREQVLMVQPSL
jgi:predicted ribosome quality control (RQC) complex YloA/Tae2 family protein